MWNHNTRNKTSNLQHHADELMLSVSSTWHLVLPQQPPPPCFIQMGLLSVPHTLSKCCNGLARLKQGHWCATGSCLLWSWSTFACAAEIRPPRDDCNNFQMHPTQLIWALWILNAQFRARKQLSLACVPEANSNTSHCPGAYCRAFSNGILQKVALKDSCWSMQSKVTENHLTS